MLLQACLSKKQASAIVNANKRINIWHGAVRSGKTHSSLIAFLIFLAENEGEFCILTRDRNSFNRNILPLLFQLIGHDARAHKDHLEIWGRKIHIVGAHDIRAEGKIRGATFAGAYVDEASLIPQSAFVMLVSRCAMGNAKIFATTNPDSPGHWLKKDFIDNNSDVQHYHFTMLDNPVLTQDERDYLTRQYKGLFYKRFILGEWCLAEGAVFDYFDEQLHVIQRQPAPAQFYLCGVDIGFTNPTAFVLLGYNDNNSPCLWVENEYFWDQKQQREPKTVSDFASDLQNFIGTRENVKFIYIDPSAASFKIELKRQEIPTPVRDGDNDVLEGIKAVSALLGNGDLKILSKCKNMIREVQSYSWDPKKSDKGYDEPIKKDDHLLDAMRYAIYTYFGNRLSFKQQRTDNPRTLGYRQTFENKQQRPQFRYGT